MYEIAKKIGYEQTTETIDDFAKLLEINENKTNVWAAVYILERIPADKPIEEKALKIIKQQADGDTADANSQRLSRRTKNTIIDSKRNRRYIKK